MAGLGETCTHVAATLFFLYLEAAAPLEERAPSTFQRCQWVMGTFQKDMDFSEVRKVIFSSASGKRKREDCESARTSSAKPRNTLAALDVVAMLSAAEKL